MLYGLGLLEGGLGLIEGRFRVGSPKLYWAPQRAVLQGLLFQNY